MKTRTAKNYLIGVGRASMALVAGGMVLSSSCSSRDVNTAIATVSAIADAVGVPATSASAGADLAQWINGLNNN